MSGTPGVAAKVATRDSRAVGALGPKPSSRLGRVAWQYGVLGPRVRVVLAGYEVAAGSAANESKAAGDTSKLTSSHSGRVTQPVGRFARTCVSYYVRAWRAVWGGSEERGHAPTKSIEVTSARQAHATGQKVPNSKAGATSHGALAAGQGFRERFETSEGFLQIVRVQVARPTLVIVRGNGKWVACVAGFDWTASLAPC